MLLSLAAGTGGVGGGAAAAEVEVLDRREDVGVVGQRVVVVVPAVGHVTAEEGDARVRQAGEHLPLLVAGRPPVLAAVGERLQGDEVGRAVALGGAEYGVEPGVVAALADSADVRVI